MKLRSANMTQNNSFGFGIEFVSLINKKIFDNYLNEIYWFEVH